MDCLRHYGARVDRTSRTYNQVSTDPLRSRHSEVDIGRSCSLGAFWGENAFPIESFLSRLLIPSLDEHVVLGFALMRPFNYLGGLCLQVVDWYLDHLAFRGERFFEVGVALEFTVILLVD